MGSCSSKSTLSLNAPKYTTQIKQGEIHGFKSSAFADTDSLIPSNSNYNSYLLNESSREIRHEFKVMYMNDKLRPIRKGYLKITKQDLTFSQYPNSNDVIVVWMLTTLRWYAYTHNLFIFQCGRKASTGEGTFVFSCVEYLELKASFEMLLNDNFSVQSPRNLMRYAKMPYPTGPNSTNTLPSSIRITNGLPNVNQQRFMRSQSVNPSCYHSCIDSYYKYLAPISGVAGNGSSHQQTLQHRVPPLQAGGGSTSSMSNADEGDLTSSESNISGGGAGNYINGVMAPMVSAVASGPEYLVPARLDLSSVVAAHGYVNEDSARA